MEQDSQVRHFLEGWTEEVAGRSGARDRRVVYLVARAAHDGREDSPGRVIPREARLH